MAFGASGDQPPGTLRSAAVSLSALGDGEVGTTGVVHGKCDAPTTQGTVKGYIDRRSSTNEVWGYVIGEGCTLTGKLRVDMYRNTDSGLEHMGGRGIGCRVDYCYSTTPTFRMSTSYSNYCVRITYNYVNNQPAGVSKWVCGS